MKIMSRELLGMSLSVGIFFLGSIAPANAALESRLDGEAYYDTDLDITWTTDANLQGADDWSSQMTWASGFMLDGISGWRLPTQDEMVHLSVDEHISASSPGPFINVLTDSYWTSTESNFFPDAALNFDFVGPNSLITPKDTALFAWAVHPGDVSPIPEPSTYLMLLAGLGLCAFRLLKRDAGSA